MGESKIYLDYAAATPCDPRVFAAMEPYFTKQFYNPSASYLAARHVREVYEDARHRLAMVIGAGQHEIIMTAGATESINCAIKGIVNHSDTDGFATSRVEHAAVTATAETLSASWIVPDVRGYITPDAVMAAVKPTTMLVSVGYINNELGTVQPLRAIAAAIEIERQSRLKNDNTTPLYLHTDASQAAGLLDISVSRLGVDLMTLNSAKCYGPKQVGLLWVRAGIELSPLIYGGGQENNLRSGTENVAGVIGFATALEIAHAERKTEAHRLRELRDMMQYGVVSAISDAVINGHLKQRAPHIVHMSIAGLDGERAVYALDHRGIMAATGSACAANHGTRSRVLEAIRMDPALADGSLRFSLGRYTTKEQVEAAIPIIVDTIQQERGR